MSMLHYPKRPIFFKFKGLNTPMTILPSDKAATSISSTCRDCDPRLARAFLDISERHYPERLAEFLVISPPSVFNMLWKAIEPWVDAHTRSKIKFLQ